MPYGLQHNEALANGLRRVAEEQLDGAIVALQSCQDLDAGIYAARKNLKRARSILRLLAPQLGPIYTEENRRLRDVARRFSALRDVHVSLELLTEFAEGYKRKSTLNPLRKAITDKQCALQRDTNWEAVLSESIASLSCTRNRIEGWPLHHLTQASLETEIQKTNIKSCHAFRHASKTRLATDFHEFRKSVKRELNQLRLLAMPDPPVSELKKLASMLGDHHNLAVLIANLENASARFRALVRTQMRQLEEGILSLGSRLYLQPVNNQARV